MAYIESDCILVLCGMFLSLKFVWEELVVAMVCYAVSHCHLLTYDRTEKSVNMWIFSIGKRTWIVNDVLISEVVDLVLYLLLVEQRIIKNGTFSMPPHQMTDKQFCHINSIVHNTLCCCGQCALFSGRFNCMQYSKMWYTTHDTYSNMWYTIHETILKSFHQTKIQNHYHTLIYKVKLRNNLEKKRLTLHLHLYGKVENNNEIKKFKSLRWCLCYITITRRVPLM
jgi:hypothetical protein